jgi:hypothetical protein
MKKNRIIKIIKQINSHEYNATIIIPLSQILFTSYSIKELKEILNKLLSKPKNILKKKESELISEIVSQDIEVEILRSFNILVNEYVIEISKQHLISDEEKTNIDNYLKDYALKYKTYKYAKTFSYIFFEYNFLLKS